MRQYLRVSVGNHAVKHNLMKIRRLQFQHLINASPTDLVSNSLDLLRSIIRTTKSCVNQLLAVPIEQLIGLAMSTCGDLDELGKSVADLRFGESAEEGKVKECVGGGVVGS